MSRFSDLKTTYALLGPKRFWALAVGVVLAIFGLTAADIWLSDKIGWPEAYGFSCHGKGCLFKDLVQSPQLLQGGSLPELGKFAVIWCMPVAAAAAVGGYVLLKKLRKDGSKPKG